MNEQKKRDIEVSRYELWWGGLMYEYNTGDMNGKR